MILTCILDVESKVVLKPIKNFDSFRSHVYRKHRDSLHFTEQSNLQNVSNPPQSSNQDNPQNFWDPDSTTTNDRHLSATALSDVTGRFILKLREEYRIPQSTTNKVIEDINGLFVTVLDLLRERNSCDGQLFNGETDLNLFRGLQNEYQQSRYYEDHFNYLVIHYIGYIHS